MEISGMKAAAIATLCLVVAARCYGTGGDSYEYPATLSDTPDILPGKSLGEIFHETSTIKPPVGNWDSTKLRELADRVGKEPLPRLLKTADDLIAQARESYTPGSDSCNLAHDVRDAVAVSAENPGAAREYILERLDGHLSGDELDQQAESATGAIKANWLYLCGAHRFASGDREECQKWFDRVVKEFPISPRAEMAMFMSARCAFSATRRSEGTTEDEETLAEARKVAIAKFEALRKKYPHGRFDADALGWLGALAFDSNDYLKALDYYIAQAEAPGHPETLKKHWDIWRQSPEATPLSLSSRVIRASRWHSFIWCSPRRRPTITMANGTIPRTCANGGAPFCRASRLLLPNRRTPTNQMTGTHVISPCWCTRPAPAGTTPRRCSSRKFRPIS